MFGDKMDDDADDMSSDDDAVDGVLNLVGENLLVVHEVTVCNKPLCSMSERGVRCNDVDLDAENATKKKTNKMKIGTIFHAKNNIQKLFRLHFFFGA